MINNNFHENYGIISDLRNWTFVKVTKSEEIFDYKWQECSLEIKKIKEKTSVDYEFEKKAFTEFYNLLCRFLGEVIKPMKKSK